MESNVRSVPVGYWVTEWLPGVTSPGVSIADVVVLLLVQHWRHPQLWGGARSDVDGVLKARGGLRKRTQNSKKFYFLNHCLNSSSLIIFLSISWGSCHSWLESGLWGHHSTGLLWSETWSAKFRFQVTKSLFNFGHGESKLLQWHKFAQHQFSLSPLSHSFTGFELIMKREKGDTLPYDWEWWFRTPQIVNSIGKHKA